MGLADGHPDEGGGYFEGQGVLGCMLEGVTDLGDGGLGDGVVEDQEWALALGCQRREWEGGGRLGKRLRGLVS